MCATIVGSSQPQVSFIVDGEDDNMNPYSHYDEHASEAISTNENTHLSNDFDTIEKPFVGMQFVSEDEACKFYNLYARNIGFSTRMSAIRKSLKTKLVTGRKIVCSKEGYKDLNDKRRVGREVKRRRDVREGCKAYIFVCEISKGLWVVREFHEEHNHDLASPSKVPRLRSHRIVSSSARSLIDTLHTCGLSGSKISSVLGASGEQHISGQVCRDQIKRNRKNNIGNECMSIVRYFEQKVKIDSDFFFRVEIDVNRMVRSVFWADGRSRSSYMTFGDVLVFDTTYRTNKFSMPFAPFTGINHHRQSTLFGCALLADESTETFMWLFNTWLTCMHGKMPTSIITDQDPAMREAISSVFPTATHRFCSWHIKKNALSHLHQLRSNKEFEQDYNKWIFKSESPEEFESKWTYLQTKYNIPHGSWLEKMYNIRQKWIHVYLKDVFFAGMSSSQRSESMNSFFDGYVHSQTPLSEFVIQYERALESRRNAEENEDFKASSSKAILVSQHPIELQASTFYTPANFKLFQEEYKRTMSCQCKKISRLDDVTIYEVYLHGNTCSKYIVEFDCLNTTASCSCKKFNSEGILCCHVLFILKKKDICMLPHTYLLHRWSLNARFCKRSEAISNNNADKPTLSMLWGLRAELNEIYELGSIDCKMFDATKEIIQDDLKRLRTLHQNEAPIPRHTSQEHIPRNDATGEHDFIDIRDPHHVKAKGRPKKAERIKFGIEASSSQPEVKQRTCHRCGEKGHYQTTCKAELPITQ